MMKVCSSDQSKIGYGYKIQKFMKFCVINRHVEDEENFEKLLELKPDQITDLLIDYTDYQRAKGDKYTTVNTALAPIIAFFDMNRRTFFKKEVTRSNTKEDVLPSGQAPATDSDVLSMVNFTYNLRNKAVIHFIANTANPQVLPQEKRRAFTAYN